MRDEITFSGIEGLLEHQTSQSAVYELLGVDEGRGSPVIGSLDIHFPCIDRGFFAVTLAIAEDFGFQLTPSQTASLLADALGIDQPELWDVRIWRINDGAVDNNDPSILKR